jgi:Tfp pilus assembly protein PilN
VNRHLLPDEIDLLLDGEAGFGVAPLRAHVRRCPECQSELETARAVAAELDDLPHFTPSSLFADRVMQQVQVFEPWHVALLDSLRRFVPQSRPARALAAAGGLSIASVLTVALLWVAARIDILTLIGSGALDRVRAALLAAGGNAVATAVGDPSQSVLSTGMGVAIVGTAFVLSLVVAAAGLRLAASASRRRRG